MAKKARPLTFKALCEAAAETVGVDVLFFPESDRKERANEDDGALHVSRFGVRACFEVDPTQSDPVKQNIRTRLILGLLGIPVTESVLVDEDDDEDCCPHCGEPL